MIIANFEIIESDGKKYSTGYCNARKKKNKMQYSENRMKVFYNAKIYKNDGSPVHDTAMAVEGGIIKGIGNDEEIFAFADKASEKIDLGGRLLLPGFVDSHLHFLEYAYEKSFVDLSGAKSIDDMLVILCGALPEAQAKNRALRGTGFDQNFWEKQELPNKDDLDKVSEEIPVIIRRTCQRVFGFLIHRGSKNTFFVQTNRNLSI